ncbi:hypothetical protein SAMN05660772_01841 [Pasteurella testudinis DSM 23072]|uniref:Uncharacterized protein n=1 Tax=Pasteurella testudinis DSM 23072 TaxID=1122938 RepID=A0A1W1UL00_9PAST|nr:hypothetical protein [Pasteurella testudinis]SMB81414.1 hypothetical protein SAMN05660772_01841 [Pasteurella testudinis DSM 23072]SUB51399.1 Uncharacterised protein [Pasteurella testudinis]
MARQDMINDAIPSADIDTSAFGDVGTENNELPTDVDRGDEVAAETPSSDAPEKVDTPEDTPPVETDTATPETEDDTPAGDENPTEKDGAEDDASPTDNEAVKAKRVPYDRFKKEVQKRKQLEEELTRLRAEQTLAADVNVDFEYQVDAGKFKAMNDAMVDGNVEQANALFNEMLTTGMQNAANAAARAAVQNAYETARNEAEQSVQARSIMSEAQQAADIVMSEYDVFNDQTESFDEAIFSEAVRVRDGLMQTGMSVGEAILEAAEMVSAKHGIKAKSLTEVEKKPAVKAPNVKAKLEQAAKVPPKVGGERHDSKPEIDIFNMSEEEFDALDPKELARLRGDYL